MNYSIEDVLSTAIEAAFSRFNLQEYLNRLSALLCPYLPMAGIRLNLYFDKCIFKIVDYRRSELLRPTPDVLRVPDALLLSAYTESPPEATMFEIRIIGTASPVPVYSELSRMMYGENSESLYLPLEYNADEEMAVYISIYTFGTNQYTQKDIALCRLLSRSLIFSLNRIAVREKIDWRLYANGYRYHPVTEQCAVPSGAGVPARNESQGEFVSLDEYIKKYILKTIAHTKGRIAGKRGAAHLLGLPTSTLWSKIRKYNIAVARHPVE